MLLLVCDPPSPLVFTGTIPSEHGHDTNLPTWCGIDQRPLLKERTDARWALAPR